MRGWDIRYPLFRRVLKGLLYTKLAGTCTFKVVFSFVLKRTRAIIISNLNTFNCESVRDVLTWAIYENKSLQYITSLSPIGGARETQTWTVYKRQCIAMNYIPQPERWIRKARWYTRDQHFNTLDHSAVKVIKVGLERLEYGQYIKDKHCNTLDHSAWRCRSSNIGCV